MGCSERSPGLVAGDVDERWPSNWAGERMAKKIRPVSVVL
jgi:hypothetical protein